MGTEPQQGKIKDKQRAYKGTRRSKTSKEQLRSKPRIRKDQER